MLNLYLPLLLQEGTGDRDGILHSVNISATPGQVVVHVSQYFSHFRLMRGMNSGAKAGISNLCEGKIQELSVKYDNYTTNFKNISENHQAMLPVLR